MPEDTPGTLFDHLKGLTDIRCATELQWTLRAVVLFHWHFSYIQVSLSDKKNIQNVRLARTGCILLGLFIICWLPFVLILTIELSVSLPQDTAKCKYYLWPLKCSGYAQKFFSSNKISWRMIIFMPLVAVIRTKLINNFFTLATMRLLQEFFP